MEAIKGAGWFALGIAALAAVFFVVAFLVSGVAAVGALVMPWLFRISRIALGISFLVLLPLSFFKRTRMFTAVGFLINSYVFGLCAWVLGFLVTYSFWGFIGVAVGLFILGIGVVPVAIVAAIFNGAWDFIGEMSILLVVLLVSRFYSIYLAQKAERENVEREYMTIESP